VASNEGGHAVDYRRSPLAAGDTGPAFALKTPYGVELTLTSCLMSGSVLVEFLRGTWDPDTRARLKALAEIHARLKERGCSTVAIICEAPGTASHYLNDAPVPFPVLVDEDRRIARAYGVWRRWSFPFRNIAQPSSFVLDRCGYIHYAYVARLSVHSADLDEIQSVVRRLSDQEPKQQTTSIG